MILPDHFPNSQSILDSSIIICIVIVLFPVKELSHTGVCLAKKRHARDVWVAEVYMYRVV